MSEKTQAAIGATAILIALALVPLIWGCGEGVSGWNVLVFIFLVVGASQLGAAAGRLARQRILGIAVTVVAVLASLVTIGIITSGTCS